MGKTLILYLIEQQLRVTTINRKKALAL